MKTTDGTGQMKSDLEQRVKLEEEDTRRVLRLALAQPFEFNENFRLATVRIGKSTRDDMMTLLTFADSVDASSAGVRGWYANGSECRDRPSVLATYHPLIHKLPDEWVRIIETAIMLAKSLERWIWVTLGEDRWVRIMVGGDPRIADEAGCPLYIDGEFQNDQFITTFSPTGEEHFVGAS